MGGRTLSRRILSTVENGNKWSADPGIGSTTPDSAARSLGAFLRRMRDRAEPATVRRGMRRRAVGLRREEVAIDAGISVTWYTWLEQGRPVRVSKRTLAAIARALRLDATERAHLFHLAEAVSEPASKARVTREASALVRSLADAMAPHPVYVVNGLWDVLHANATAHTVFGGFGAAPGVTDNVLRRLFLDDGWRTRFPDWGSVAGSAVAQFRAATGHLVGNSRWAAFIDRLAVESREFADRWRKHELATAFSREKVVAHPEVGRLRFLYASVAPDAEPADVRLIVYTPADPETAGRLSRLGAPDRTLEARSADATNGAGSRPRAVRRRHR